MDQNEERKFEAKKYITLILLTIRMKRERKKCEPNAGQENV